MPYYQAFLTSTSGTRVVSIFRLSRDGLGSPFGFPHPHLVLRNSCPHQSQRVLYVTIAASNNTAHPSTLVFSLSLKEWSVVDYRAYGATYQ